MRALALAVLLAAAAAPARAVRPLTPPAPEFPLDDAWLNALPLTLGLMSDRKAVVVAFLNPTDLHSLRILPVLKGWFDRYALNQLMVVGVVTPDLEVSHDAAWVQSQLKRFGVEFPVVIDGDRRLWKAYKPEGWPALYLVDRRSRIAFDRLGEGGYAEFEDEIREALSEVGDPNALPPPLRPPEPGSTNCGHATPDVAMGARSRTAALRLDEDFSRRRQLVVEGREGELSTLGRWDAEPDGLRLAQANADQAAFVRVVFEAAQALAVLTPPSNRKARVFVKLDDLWLHEGDAGGDVKYDDDGRSYVEVGDARLYDLVRDDGRKAHELYVIPERQGVGVHGFSFADACLVTRLP